MSEINQDVAPAAEPDSVPEQVEPQLPGRFLREAREARNMSVFEVAQSLKFGARQIEALEADDYAALPQGATFVRGFVRGYSKLLKLDPDRLLAMLDTRTPAALPEVREPQNMGVAATAVAAGSRSSRPMAFGSAAIAVLAVVLGVWHFLSEPMDPAASKPAATEAPAAVPAPVAENDAVRPPDIRVESTPADPADPAAPIPPLPPEGPQLVFTFGDKSWVEVRDARQRILLSSENPAGTRQVVSGKPPFEVVIGNAAKVEVQYGDRQIDLKPHIRAEVARLTIE